MKMKFSLFVFSFLVLLSCTQTFRLSEKDYEWIPYKGNEILIFKSNSGDLDTVFLLRKDTLLVYDQPQSVNGAKNEAVSIFCEHSDANMPKNKNRYLKSNFFRLEKVNSSRVEMKINFSAKDAKFYRLSRINVDSLRKIKPVAIQTSFGNYNDIYIITGEDYLGNFHQRSNYITKLYWSKSKGLVRYDKIDSVYWVKIQ